MGRRKSMFYQGRKGESETSSKRNVAVSKLAINGINSLKKVVKRSSDGVGAGCAVSWEEGQPVVRRIGGSCKEEVKDGADVRQRRLGIEG